MVREARLNDIDYCYASLKLIKDLEKNINLKDHTIRIFEEKIQTRYSHFISIFSIIISLLFLFSLFFLQVELQLWKVIILILSMGVYFLVYSVINKFGNRKIMLLWRGKITADLNRELFYRVNEYDECSLMIIQKKVFTDPRIPESYFNLEILSLLINYLELGQIYTIEEALYSLNQEINNTKYYPKLFVKDNLLQRVREELLNSRKLYIR
jgi:hypothetical protein